MENIAKSTFLLPICLGIICFDEWQKQLFNHFE